LGIEQIKEGSNFGRFCRWSSCIGIHIFELRVLKKTWLLFPIALDETFDTSRHFGFDCLVLKYLAEFSEDQVEASI
jgi:hypothetical protein